MRGDNGLIPPSLVELRRTSRLARNDAASTEYDSAISRRDTPELLMTGPPKKRGRRECRVLAAPAVSCAKVCKKSTRAYRYSRSIPAFPAQWFYGLYRALPGDEFVLSPSLTD